MATERIGKHRRQDVEMRTNLAVCALLLLAVALVFGQTVRHDFVNFDDDKYVTNNPHVTQGLTGPSIAWAFSARHASNWHPVTWLSHMLDCQLFGQAAWGHHLTNILLHAATAIGLFLVLREMTGDLWPSALVAALFAIHPLRVESVAWVAERKDVLSGLLFMLTLAAYLAYVRRPFAWSRYLLVVGLFALGLMAKPMLVSLPVVLLLLDYWPLARLPIPRTSSLKDAIRTRVAVEKVPLLLLAAGSCAVTLWAQNDAIVNSEHATLPWRLGNAAVTYVAYMAQMVCPIALAVLYPHPGTGLPVWQAVGSLLILAAISAGVVVGRRRYPYMLVGWLWYIVMLVPVIGLLQVGLQARADRYTYLPLIGLYLAIAWGVAALARAYSVRAWWCRAVVAVVLLALLGCAWQQTSYWHDSETLWNHTLACTDDNPVGHYNLGVALAKGSVDQAINEYEKAVKISPNYAVARYNLGVALVDRGQIDDAIAQFRRATEVSPDFADAHNNLGSALAGRGQVDEAIERYHKALAIKPDLAEAHNNLGNALLGRGEINEAMAEYGKALEIKPDYADAHNNLATALQGLGKIQEAITHYRQALEIKPSYAQAHYNLAVALQSCGRIGEAVAHYQQALQIRPTLAEAHNNLGGILARQGRRNDAIAHFRRALEINPRYEGARRNLEMALGQANEIPAASPR
jgi:protein O-mannosyl-transferase